MNGQQPYKMSFSTGGLFLNESIEVARLHLPGEPWEDTIVRALAEGTTSLPKAASNRRSLREIVNRLATLTDEEIAFLVEEADRHEAQALLWMATCRAYRFVREYAVEVVQDRYLSYQLDLPQQSFDLLLEAKADWHAELAGLSASTRGKLRQVLFRMMREAAIISDSDQIQRAVLSSRVQFLIEQTAPQDMSVFPGFAPNGV